MLSEITGDLVVHGIDVLVILVDGDGRDVGVAVVAAL